MSIYRFSTAVFNFYDVEAESKEEAEEKLENAEDLAEYFVFTENDWQEKHPFHFEDVIG